MNYINTTQKLDYLVFKNQAIYIRCLNFGINLWVGRLFFTQIILILGIVSKETGAALVGN